MAPRFSIGVFVMLAACCLATVASAQGRAATSGSVDITGTVEVRYEDYPEFSRLQHFLHTESESFLLRFDGNGPRWKTGDRVRVRGNRLNNTIALDGGSALMVASRVSLSGTTGVHKVLLMLVNFRDNPSAQPYTLSYASDVLFNITNAYYQEASSGRTSIVGNAMGWITVNMDSGTCDPTKLATLARQAAANNGVDVYAYDHLMFAFPKNPCGWWGLGSLGGSPSHAWVNGNFKLDVAGHELGHNIGLYHSRSMDCGADPIGPTCTHAEYGDTLDLMGATKGHFNAFQKERLGWLTEGQVVNVNSSGHYFIEPYESTTGGVKSLKILKSIDSAGDRTFYYLEFRQPIGFDAFMSGFTNIMNGVSIHTGSESAGNSSYLLDMTPATDNFYDPALQSGGTFTDSAASVSVTVNSVSSDGASVFVSVSNSGSGCSTESPTVVLSGSGSAVAPGSTVNYAATITNHDSSGCASSSFLLSSTVPSGWNWAFDATSVTLAPGSSATTVLRVTSPASASGGVYSVSARAQDQALSTHAGTGSANYTIASTSPRTVQVATDRGSYSRGAVVQVSALVASNSAPVSGALVTITIRTSQGKVTTSSATTGSDGVAKDTLRLKPKDPTGTYTVTATSNGTTATTTFTVN